MTECVEHTQKGWNGYGTKSVKVNGVWRMGKLHRLAYCEAHGLSLDDIAGKVVMHTCDNPRCINPDHLVLGTQAQNNADRHAKGRDGNTRRVPDDVRARVRGLNQYAPAVFTANAMAPIFRMCVKNVRRILAEDGPVHEIDADMLAVWVSRCDTYQRYRLNKLLLKLV